MKFKVPGAPQGKARARTYCDRRTRRMKSITPEKTVLYENLIKTSYIAAAEKEQFKGYFNKEPVQIGILAIYPIPQSKSKKRIAAAPAKYRRFFMFPSPLCAERTS